MWENIFSTFTTDHLAFVVHAYLLSGDVLATIAVGLGIVWENGADEVRPVAHKLVIWGVVAETLCSLALFTFDEGISSSQQYKILVLEERLAPRGFSQGDESEMVKVLAPFAGTEFFIAMASPTGEASTFANELKSLLEKSGWKYSDLGKGMFPGEMEGVYLYSANPGVTALAVELNKRAIRASVDFFTNPGASQRVGIFIGSKP